MKKLLLGLTCLSFIACSNDSISKEQYDVKLKEIKGLKQQIERLNAEIYELKHGAAQELALAKKAIESKYWDAAIAHAQLVIDNHPEVPEAKEAIILISQAKASKEAAKAEAERELAKTMAKMNKKQDKMRGITIWRAPAMPGFVNSKSWVGAYIIETENGAPYLRIAIYYVASDWLFVKKYLFNIDGKKYDISPPEYGDGSIKTDSGEGGIWEWWDVLAEGEPLAILNAISVAKEATLRYEGKDYYKDHNIGQAERDAIKNTLKAFDFLSNK